MNQMSQADFDNFLGLPPELCDLELARFAIVPVPYEATVSYGGGTADGPRAIIEASQQVELFDGISEPADAGVVTLPVVAVDGVSAEVMIERVSKMVGGVVGRGQIPVVLGGEHTVTLGAVEAVAKQYGSGFGVIQFDAHADLRDEYDGTPYSHACVMRRIHGRGIPVAQFGVRSLCREQQAYREANKGSLAYVDARQIMVEGLPEQLLPESFPHRVYLTFDVDGLDPSVLPGTGTPEPGGLDWYTALEAVERVLAGRELIGFDVVELAPIPGTHVSEFVAAKLTYAIMGQVVRSLE
jgi:agmatinase